MCLFLIPFPWKSSTQSYQRERFIKWRKFRRGDTIIKQGTFDQHFHIIIQGKIETIRPGRVQKEISAGTRTEGEIFGEMAVCAPGKPRRANVQAAGAEDVVVCEIDNRKVFPVV